MGFQVLPLESSLVRLAIKVQTQARNAVHKLTRNRPQAESDFSRIVRLKEEEEEEIVYSQFSSIITTFFDSKNTPWSHQAICANVSQHTFINQSISRVKNEIMKKHLKRFSLFILSHDLIVRHCDQLTVWESKLSALVRA